MAQKTLTLILFGADRKLWAGGDTQLTINDLSRSPMKLLANKKLKSTTTTVQVDLDLQFNAGQVYGVIVDSDGHRPAWQLVRRRTFVRQEGSEEIEGQEALMRLILIPKKPSSSGLEGAYKQLIDRGSPIVAKDSGLTEQLYLNLETAAKMALLNLEAKLRKTFLNSSSLLSSVTGVRHVAADRVYLFMKPELKTLVERSRDFASAPGHTKPKQFPDLPAHPDSWKHLRFGAGNIQLSFSKTTEPSHGNAATQDFSVDVDLDLERGLGHVFEWLDNNAVHPGKKTDQTIVYSLLFSQGILPSYTLDPAAS